MSIKNKTLRDIFYLNNKSMLTFFLKNNNTAIKDDSLNYKDLKNAKISMVRILSEYGFKPEEMVFHHDDCVARLALNHINKDDINLKSMPKKIIRSTNKYIKKILIERDIHVNEFIYDEEYILKEIEKEHGVNGVFYKINESKLNFKKIKNKPENIQIAFAKLGVFVHELFLSKSTKVSQEAYEHHKFNIYSVDFSSLNKKNIHNLSAFSKVILAKNDILIDCILYCENTFVLNYILENKSINFDNHDVNNIKNYPVLTKKLIEKNILVNELVEVLADKKLIELCLKSNVFDTTKINLTWDELKGKLEILLIEFAKGERYLNELFFSGNLNIIKNIIKNKLFLPKSLDKNMLYMYIESCENIDLKTIIEKTIFSNKITKVNKNKPFKL